MSALSHTHELLNTIAGTLVSFHINSSMIWNMICVLVCVTGWHYTQHFLYVFIPETDSLGPPSSNLTWTLGGWFQQGQSFSTYWSLRTSLPATNKRTVRSAKSSQWKPKDYITHCVEGLYDLEPIASVVTL